MAAIKIDASATGGSRALSCGRLEFVTEESLWPAPAKLNLFLHVTGRRPDGYHELQTVFQLIDLCDTIGLSVREDGRIERPDGPLGVDPESDLTVRAARALQQASGCTVGVTLRVRKP